MLGGALTLRNDEHRHLPDLVARHANDKGGHMGAVEREELQEKIVDYIAAGGGRRISSDEVRERFLIEPRGGGNPVTRGLIKQAMRGVALDRGIPIGADSWGYFLVISSLALETYLRNLDARIEGIKERKRLVHSAWLTRPGQGYKEG